MVSVSSLQWTTQTIFIRKHRWSTRWSGLRRASVCVGTRLWWIWFQATLNSVPWGTKVRFAKHASVKSDFESSCSPWAMLEDVDFLFPIMPGVMVSSHGLKSWAKLKSSENRSWFSAKAPRGDGVNCSQQWNLTYPGVRTFAGNVLRPRSTKSWALAQPGAARSRVTQRAAKEPESWVGEHFRALPC